MDVGLELRQARERHGISLQQLSNTTKISPRVLQAIDAGDEDRLPARVFTRAFVKTYALEVGLDPEDTMRRYLAQFEKPAPPDAGAAQRSPESSPLASAASIDQRLPGRILRGRFGTAAVLLLVAAAIFGLTNLRHANKPSSAADLRQSAVAMQGLVPATTSPAVVGTSGIARDVGILHIAIAPTGPCWVQATAGDNRLFGELLSARDRRVIDEAETTLRIGDPATFAFTINGKPAYIAAAPGRAVTVHITGANYGQFLKR